MVTRLSLRLRVFLFFCLIGLGNVVIVCAAAGFAASRFDPAQPVGGFVTTAVLTSFLSVALALAVWRLFDENVAKAIEVLASGMRARAHGGVSHDFDRSLARYLGDLAPAASAVTDTLAETKGAVKEAVSRETALLNAQTEKLKALVSDVPVGLIICGPNHRMVFYNTPAKDMLAETGRPRLDRSVFDLLRQGPIRKTYNRLVSSGRAEQDAEVLLSTTKCARSLSAHMRLVRGAMGMTSDAPGYVLTLRDVTSDLGHHRERERLLADIVEQIRRPAAGLKALLDLQAETTAPLPADLSQDILNRSEDLTMAVQRIAEDYDTAWRSWWPMQDVQAGELIDGLRAHLGDDGPLLESMPPDVVLRCDGVAFIDLLAVLARAVKSEGLAEVLSLTITVTDGEAEFRLTWQGEPMEVSALDRVLSHPMDEAEGDLTGRAVLDHHGTDIWPEWDADGGAWLTLPLPDARLAPEAPHRAGNLPERTAVFDFDLLAGTDHAAIDDTPLTRLTYVIFDTETTGLNPNGGDEIVQIAAVRAVNGKLVPGEVIDQLVDPERPIPASSTAVHGVSEDMVKGQPTIREAGAQFHRFSHKAVLVAHNAPFDMAFFHRHGPSFGATFDNPVLDTVLLSAILFGQQEEHTLDALAERFGVVIPEHARHTALGDTIATAQVFLRMIPMLQARGMTTFGEVLSAMGKNARLMKEMKARVSG